MSTMNKIAMIRSGGQTGADRGALDAARSLNFPTCGWCPQGGRADDMPDPPGLLALYPELIETPSPDYLQRTAWNVRDAHATLVVVPSADWYSPGTAYTIEVAHLYERPCLTVVGVNIDAAARWLESLAGFELTLNIAGPRESFSRDIYHLSFQLVSALLHQQDRVGTIQERREMDRSH